MSTSLFHDTVFGPIKSRRLGISLGINLLPTNSKLCNYNCLYCECGWNPEHKQATVLPKAEEVNQLLRQKLASLKTENIRPDVMTFAGNGEPSLHPQFLEIVKNTIALRNEFFPTCRVAVLSNASRSGNSDVFKALQLVDDPILKFDAGSERIYQLINQPVKGLSLQKIFQNLEKFNGDFIMQSLFLRGEVNGVYFDNSAEPEFSAWLDAVKLLRPRKVMLYSLDRDTPHPDLIKLSKPELEDLAAHLQVLHIQTEVA